MPLVINSLKNWQTQRWRSAIPRHKISMPFRVWLENSYIQKNDTILDFGCGHGTCVNFLKLQGYKIWGYDPYFCDDRSLLDKKYSIVVLNYVLNVIENQEEVVDVIKLAWELCQSCLLISFRPGKGQCEYTKIGTFQQYFSPSGIAELIVNSVGIKPLVIGRGLLYVPKTNMYYFTNNMEITISKGSLQKLLSSPVMDAEIGQLTYTNGYLSLLIKQEDKSVLTSITTDCGDNSFSYPVNLKELLKVAQSSSKAKVKLAVEKGILYSVSGKNKTKLSTQEEEIQLQQRNWSDPMFLPLEPFHQLLSFLEGKEAASFVFEALNYYGALYMMSEKVVSVCTFKCGCADTKISFPLIALDAIKKMKFEPEKVIYIQLSDDFNYLRIHDDSEGLSLIVDVSIGEIPIDIPDKIFSLGKPIGSLNSLRTDVLEKLEESKVEVILGNYLNIIEYFHFDGGEKEWCIAEIERESAVEEFKLKTSFSLIKKALLLKNLNASISIVDREDSGLKGIIISFPDGTQTLIFAEIETIPISEPKKEDYLPQPKVEKIVEVVNNDQSMLEIVKKEVPLEDEQKSLYQLVEDARRQKKEIEQALTVAADEGRKKELQEIVGKLDQIILLADKEFSKDEFNLEDIEAIRLQLLWVGGRMISFALNKKTKWKFSVSIVR